MQIRMGRRLQRPQRARLLTVSIRLGDVGLPHVLDQHTPARGSTPQTGIVGVVMT